MASSIWTIEYFSCHSCGLPYTATREHHPERHSGSFKCEVCATKVHEWSGNYDFFDWKVDQVKSPVFGKRWGWSSIGSSNFRCQPLSPIRRQHLCLQPRLRCTRSPS